MGECAKRGLEIGSFRCQVNRERLEGIIERTIECSIGAQGYYEFLESRTMNGGRRRRARESTAHAAGSSDGVVHGTPQGIDQSSPVLGFHCRVIQRLRDAPDGLADGVGDPVDALGHPPVQRVQQRLYGLRGMNGDVLDHFNGLHVVDAQAM